MTLAARDLSVANRLSDVFLDLHSGEITAICGPNGAGKTSALRILSTVLRPTSGQATVNGYDVLTQPSLVRHQIGFVSTNTAVYDRMTAWEMVEYFGRLYGLHPDELRPRMESIFDRMESGNNDPNVTKTFVMHFGATPTASGGASRR